VNRPEGPAQRLAPCASSLARGKIGLSLMRGYFPAIGYQQAELEGVGGGSLCRFVCLSLHSLSRIPTAGDNASIQSPFRRVSRDGGGDLTWMTIGVVT